MQTASASAGVRRLRRVLLLTWLFGWRASTQRVPGHQADCVQWHNRIVPSLVDVVSALASADPEATIYVSTPIGPYSDAVVCIEPDDGGSPAGFTYLIEVSLARNVLHVWSRWRDGKQPTLEEAARAVIHYAQYDAYEPVRPTA